MATELVDLRVSQPSSLPSWSAKIIGDLALFVYMKGRAAIAAAAQGRPELWKIYAWLCINARVSNVRFSA
jgi:hypothetical protein